MGFEQLAELRQQLAMQAEKNRENDKEKRAPGKPAPRSDKTGSGAKPAAKQQGKGAPRQDKPGAPRERTGARPEEGANRPDRNAAGQGKNTARAQRPARPTRPARPDVDPVVLTISRLQREFPVAFPKKPAAKVPLKLGIHQELLLQSETLGLPNEDITLAIKTWCRGSRYWACLVEGVARIDLNGEANGTVTAIEAQRARQLERRQRATAIKSKKAAAAGTEGTTGDAAATSEGAATDTAAATSETAVTAAASATGEVAGQAVDVSVKADAVATDAASPSPAPAAVQQDAPSADKPSEDEKA